MAIFTARRIAIGRPSRAQAASEKAQTAAAAEAISAGHGILTIGPEIAHPLAEVEVEEAADKTVSTALHGLATRHGSRFAIPRTTDARTRAPDVAWIQLTP